MVRTIAGVLSLALIAAAPASAELPHLLARYDFDVDGVATGPWLMVFEHSKGQVSLSSTYPFSGTRSVEIRDVAGDGDFTELQGFVALRTHGKLLFHFSFMTAEPYEELNVAVAGPAHFFLVEDGMAFWLKAEDGVLKHMANREWQELMPLAGFTWYIVDATLDVDRGTYDLTIREERADEPLVALRDQPNAIGRPGSAVRKFSFIGAEPGRDSSDVVFYVDDLVIATDDPVHQQPFVAGRRMLFIDLYDRWRAHLFERPGCPPVLDAGDFGLRPRDLQALDRAGQLGRFESLADGNKPRGEPARPLPDYLAQALRSMELWRRGCAEPTRRRQARAVELFREAGAATPEAKLYPMSEVLALVALRRWPEADERLLSIYPDWQSDPRFPALSATIGIARGRLHEAESWLGTELHALPETHSSPAVKRLWSGQIDRGLVAELKSEFPDAWAAIVEQALIVEHRYYVLLWQGDHEAARDYAARMVDRFRRMGLPEAVWLEREGDAAFYARDHVGALAAYEASLESQPGRVSSLLKLSDVHFKLGNPDLERAYRERVYGSLEREEDHAARPDRCDCPPGPVDPDAGRLR